MEIKLKIIDFIINLITGLVPVFGVLVGYYIANKKYIFQKTYERKLAYIMDFHKQIVNLDFAVKEYVHFIGADTKEEFISKRIESLNKVKSSFQQFQHKFWEVEIILDESTVDKIKKFLAKYIEITSKLVKSNIEQQLRAHKESFDSWNESFNMISNDLAPIKEELKNEFRQVIQKNH